MATVDLFQVGFALVGLELGWRGNLGREGHWASVFGQGAFAALAAYLAYCEGIVRWFGDGSGKVLIANMGLRIVLVGLGMQIGFGLGAFAIPKNHRGQWAFGASALLAFLGVMLKWIGTGLLLGDGTSPWGN
jgi:hypothetical protein